MIDPAATWALIALGGAVFVAAQVAAYRLGRHVTDMAGLQQRQTMRDVMAANKLYDRQVEQIRDGLSRLIADPRTREGTRLELERLHQLTIERRPP